MTTTALTTEALLHCAGVAARHRQADQVPEVRLYVGALGVGKRLHVGGSVDDCHVGSPDHKTQVHEVQLARRVLPAGPGALVVEGPDDGEILVALEDLHGDGPAVHGLLARARW